MHKRTYVFPRRRLDFRRVMPGTVAGEEMLQCRKQTGTGTQKRERENTPARKPDHTAARRKCPAGNTGNRHLPPENPQNIVEKPGSRKFTAQSTPAQHTNGQLLPHGIPGEATGKRAERGRQCSGIHTGTGDRAQSLRKAAFPGCTGNAISFHPRRDHPRKQGRNPPPLRSRHGPQIR